MNASLTEVIEKLAMLSATANDQGAAMKALVSGNQLLLDIASLSKASELAETTEAHIELKRFLKSLNEDYVYALLTLMYSGRDKAADPVEHWKTLRITVASKEDAIRTILEKEPRMEYIREGIARRPRYLSLDELPGLLGEA